MLGPYGTGYSLVNKGFCFLICSVSGGTRLTNLPWQFMSVFLWQIHACTNTCQPCTHIQRYTATCSVADSTEMFLAAHFHALSPGTISRGTSLLSNKNDTSVLSSLDMGSSSDRTQDEASFFSLLIAADFRCVTSGDFSKSNAGLSSWYLHEPTRASERLPIHTQSSKDRSASDARII